MVMFISKLSFFFGLLETGSRFSSSDGSELPIGCLLFALFGASARGRDFNCLICISCIKS